MALHVILSPAKSLDFEFDASDKNCSSPEFEDKVEYLVGKLKKLSAKQLSKLMHISPALGELNQERYQSFKFPFSSNNAKPALLAFRGNVYQGIKAQSFNQNDLDFAQNNISILSGLYGLLKPLDLMQPYRLEMGTKFAVTPKQSNLYKFWNDQITNHLNSQLGEEKTLINLASNEYFKAVNTKLLKKPFITCQFKDAKNGEFKTIMTFAKLARGYMTNYIVKNSISSVEDLKGFDQEGYCFNTRFSSETEFVFTRG